MSDPRPTKKSRIVRSEPNPSSTPLSSTSSEAVNVSCTNNNARRMKLAHSVVLRLHKNKGARRQAQSAQKVSHASSSGHTEVEDSVVDTTAAAGGADDEGDASVTGPQASSSSDVPKRAAVSADHIIWHSIQLMLFFFSQDLARTGCHSARNI